MTEIDLETWKRKEHFLFFKDMSHPVYNLCFDIDITGLHRFAKLHEHPLYLAIIYYCMHCVNSIDEFKYRYRDGKVLRFDSVHPSFTVLDKETELFKIITISADAAFGEFVETARRQEKAQKTIVDSEMEHRDDLVYITAIPWISFTSISHVFSLGDFDSIPRISWGKTKLSGDRVMLPFSVQVNHAFVDGYHIGRLNEELGKTQEKLEEIFA